jgi:hypothetical protein
LLALDEERRNIRREHAEQGNASQHQERCDPASGRSHGERVAIPDGRDRGNRPPQRIPEGVDAALPAFLDGERESGRAQHDNSCDEHGVVELVTEQQPSTLLPELPQHTHQSTQA